VGSLAKFGKTCIPPPPEQLPALLGPGRPHPHWQELAGELLPGTIGAELQEMEETV
jgi:hypothetical protein